MAVVNKISYVEMRSHVEQTTFLLRYPVRHELRFEIVERFINLIIIIIMVIFKCYFS